MLIVKIAIMIYIAVCFLVLLYEIKRLEKECAKWREMYFETKKELLNKLFDEKYKLNNRGYPRKYRNRFFHKTAGAGIETFIFEVRKKQMKKSTQRVQIQIIITG